MLPPVAAVSSVTTIAAQREVVAVADVLASLATEPDGAVALSLAVSSVVEGKLNMLLINARERMVASLFAVIDAVSQSLALPQDAGESNAGYALRLADAMTDLPETQMASLQQQLVAQGQTAPLSLVAAALKDPTGAQAAQLVAYLEVVRYKDRDLATRSVVASYGQNDGSAEPETAVFTEAPVRNAPAQAETPVKAATPLQPGLPSPAVSTPIAVSADPTDLPSRPATEQPRPLSAATAIVEEAGAPSPQAQPNQPSAGFTGQTAASAANLPSPPAATPLPSSNATQPPASAATPVPASIPPSEPAATAAAAATVDQPLAAAATQLPAPGASQTPAPTTIPLSASAATVPSAAAIPPSAPAATAAAAATANQPLAAAATQLPAPGASQTPTTIPLSASSATVPSAAVSEHPVAAITQPIAAPANQPSAQAATPSSAHAATQPSASAADAPSAAANPSFTAAGTQFPADTAIQPPATRPAFPPSAPAVNAPLAAIANRPFAAAANQVSDPTSSEPPAPPNNPSSASTAGQPLAEAANLPPTARAAAAVAQALKTIAPETVAEAAELPADMSVLTAEETTPRAILQIRSDIKDGLKAVFDRLVQATGTELLQTMAEAAPLADKIIAQALVADMIDGIELEGLPMPENGKVAERTATTSQPLAISVTPDIIDGAPTAQAAASNEMLADTAEPPQTVLQQPQVLPPALVVGFVTTPYAPAEDVVKNKDAMRIDRVDAVDDDEHEGPGSQQQEESPDDEHESSAEEALEMLAADAPSTSAEAAAQSSRSSLMSPLPPAATEPVHNPGYDLYERMGA